VDEDIIEEARLGRYGCRAVSRVDDSLLERYFSFSSGLHRVHPELMKRISYRPLNLVSGALDLPEAPFHVVFLRNVLIYFSPAAQRRVVERVSGAMAGDGVLFVGPAESLWQLRTGLEPWDLGSCFCYRMPAVGAPSARVSEVENGVTSSELRVSGWVEDDTEEPLQKDGDPGTARAGEGRSREETIDRLAQLVAGDDYATAVSVAVDACRRTPDDSVLRAIEGRLLELTDEPERAVAAYRAALYLDPRSCVVRYLLAGCLVRLGRTARARRELRALLAASSSSQCTDIPELSLFGIPRLEDIEALGRELLDQT
jgi:hypothetical protein